MESVTFTVFVQISINQKPYDVILKTNILGGLEYYCGRLNYDTLLTHTTLH